MKRGKFTSETAEHVLCMIVVDSREVGVFDERRVTAKARQMCLSDRPCTVHHAPSPQPRALQCTTRFPVADGSLMKRGKFTSETAEHVLYMIVGDSREVGVFDERGNPVKP